MHLFIKGLIIGLGKILPGISGGLLAIMLGVYDQAINSITNYFSNIKKNTIYLLLLGSGVLISVVFFSKIVLFTLNNYYLPTMLLFIGLIVGGTIDVYHKINKKNILVSIASLAIMLSISLITMNYNVVVDSIYAFIIGMVEAVTMIVPGISGTAIMMIMGVYEQVITIISNMGSISFIINNLLFIVPFFLGIIIGALICIKLVDIMLKKYHDLFYSSILGFSIGSIILLFINTFKNSYSLITIIISLVLLIVGYYISKYFND